MEEELRRIYAEHIHNKRKLGEARKALSRRLEWPIYIIANKAQELGLSCDIRRPWLKDEIALLEKHAGSKPLTYFTRRLKRSRQSVRSMFNNLSLHYRITDGYSQQEVALVFGVSGLLVSKWISRGWLTPSQDTKRIPESEVLDFIKTHPEEYRLKRVDEPWFKSMLFPSFGLPGRGKEKIA